MADPIAARGVGLGPAGRTVRQQPLHRMFVLVMGNSVQTLQLMESFVPQKKNGKSAWRGFRSGSQKLLRPKFLRHFDVMMAMLAPQLQSFECSERILQQCAETAI